MDNKYSAIQQAKSDLDQRINEFLAEEEVKSSLKGHLIYSVSVEVREGEKSLNHLVGHKFVVSSTEPERLIEKIRGLDPALNSYDLKIVEVEPFDWRIGVPILSSLRVGKVTVSTLEYDKINREFLVDLAWSRLK